MWGKKDRGGGLAACELIDGYAYWRGECHAKTEIDGAGFPTPVGFLYDKGHDY